MKTRTMNRVPMSQPSPQGYRWTIWACVLGFAWMLGACNLFLDDEIGGLGQPCAEDNQACKGDLVCDTQTMLCVQALTDEDGDTDDDDDDDDDDVSDGDEDGDTDDDDDDVSDGDEDGDTDDDDDDDSDGDEDGDTDDDDDDDSDGDLETCTDACEAGETRCVTGSSEQVCDKVLDGCLTWNTPSDCPADLVCQDTDDAGHGECLPVPADAGDLRISEFMVSTDAFVQDKQWIEVYNRTNTTLSLQGLTIKNGLEEHTFSSQATLEPFSYGVISRFDPPSEGLQNVLYSGFGFQINSLTGTIVLRRDDIILDSLDYNALWVRSNQSTQLDPEYLNEEDVSSRDVWCFQDDTFYASQLLGTPGSANSPCNGDVDGDEDGDGEDCDDQCSSGQSRCVSETQVEVCRIQDNGCHDWNPAEDCPGEAPLCDAESHSCIACESTCSTLNEALCVDNWNKEVCREVLPGCRQWSEPDACGSGYHCEGDACVAGCIHECTSLEARRCGDDSAYQECLKDSSNCRYWSSPVYCGDDVSCINGFCESDGCEQDSCPDGYTCEVSAEPCRADLPDPDEVIFSEFLVFSSASPASNSEWVELYNRSMRHLTLSGLTFGNLTRQEEIPQGVVIAPGAYVTLTRSAVADEGVENLAMTGYDFDLTNLSGSLVLKKGDVEISRVTYATTWIQAGAATQLDRDRLDDENYSSAVFWCASTNGYNPDYYGTPGSANEACSTANLCSDDCTPSGAKTCVSDNATPAYQTCGQNDEDECLEWGEAIPCNDPPQDYCLDEDTLYHMDGAATCENGLCHYSGTSESCSNGCSGGACQ